MVCAAAGGYGELFRWRRELVRLHDAGEQSAHQARRAAWDQLLEGGPRPPPAT